MLVWLKVPIKSQMQGDERFVGLPQFSKYHVILVSTKQIYLFEYEDFFEEFELATPAYLFPHPVNLDQISLIESYRLVDGFIISYMGYNYHGFDRPGAEIFYVQLDAPMEKIHSTEFKQHSYPDVIRHLSYIASPLYYPFYRSFFHMGESTANRQSSIGEIYSRKMPMAIKVTAIILQVFTTIIVFLLASRLDLSTKSKLVWTVLAAIVGLTALLSFLLLNKVSGISTILKKEPNFPEG